LVSSCNRWLNTKIWIDMQLKSFILTLQYQHVKEKRIDLKRLERIRWIKEIIEKYSDGSILMWADIRYPEPRIHIWYNKEYVVVLILKKSKPYYQLLTAFITKGNKVIDFEMDYKKYAIKKPMSP